MKRKSLFYNLRLFERGRQKTKRRFLRQGIVFLHKFNELFCDIAKKRRGGANGGLNFPVVGISARKQYVNLFFRVRRVLRQDVFSCDGKNIRGSNVRIV